MKGDTLNFAKRKTKKKSNLDKLEAYKTKQYKRRYTELQEELQEDELSSVYRKEYY